MSAKANLAWVLLLLRLPATHSAERVAIWRKLKKSGAIQIQTSTYILPDDPPRYETFQWLTQHIRDSGGDATLVRVRSIEGLSNERLMELFNAARTKEYAALREMLRPLMSRSTRISNLDGSLDRIRKQFREIRETDFFGNPKAKDLEKVLRKLEEAQPKSKAQPRLERRDFRDKIWLTRSRPEIDRVGSAWLIRKLIDPKAKFVFGTKRGPNRRGRARGRGGGGMWGVGGGGWLIRKFIDPKAKFVFGTKRGPNRRVLTFDMLEGDFSHDGDDCTFETLIRRFGVQDKVACKIAEMVHDADLADDKFQRTECIGIDRVLKGWAKENLSDREILR